MATQSVTSEQILASSPQPPNIELSLDAFVRSVGVKRSSPLAVFLGAGASVSSGIPSAEMCIWEWKRQIFLTNNPGLESQFEELSLEGVRRRIQEWLDRQGNYPSEGSLEEYGFYIQRCFPIADDRRAFFQSKIRDAKPHIGYQLLCLLAENDLIRFIWSSNFDGLSSRTAANYRLTPIDVSIDAQSRINRMPSASELLCVSMHGDYRYDQLKNTAEELQKQEAAIQAAFIDGLRETSLIVCGYSGRDQSIMNTLKDAYSQPGNGTLYWCGFSDKDAPQQVIELIKHARAHGRQAYYVPTLGFDDLFIRLASHCLQGVERSAAERIMHAFTASDKHARALFQVRKFESNTLIKSNAFSIECPAEVLQFDLQKWPEKGEVWPYIRSHNNGKPIEAVPFKGKVFALGNTDDVKKAYEGNIKGQIERTPISPTDLKYDDGHIVSLMCSALVHCMSAAKDLPTDGRRELWEKKPQKTETQGSNRYEAHSSVRLSFRRIGNLQYLVLKPSIKVLDGTGTDAPLDIANPIKLGILGYQHNKEFNDAVKKWAKVLFPDSETIYEYPHNSGSTFRFKIRRHPVFGEIGLPQGGPIIKIPDNLKPLLKYSGLQLPEPELLFSNKSGTSIVKSPHPIRGIIANRPYDYSLTVKGFFSQLRLGVVCATTEAKTLHMYLHNINRTHKPLPKEVDYLVDFPGFQSAYGLPVEIPTPGQTGWYTCPEPASDDSKLGSLEIAGHINRGIESLQSSYAPDVVLILYPTRWNGLRGYRSEVEHFDVHDFVKAFCVQRGIATQFLEQATFEDNQQCRVWWWLSLALYVKGMRTPWLLNGLASDTAFVGLGFSINPNATQGEHVVLGCSHIYSNKGEGLQYRLSKIENPIIRQGNPFMSKDDARRTGEMIRQLFFDAHFKLPNRVVLHKRTPFTRDEREGLIDGLSGVENIDMLEIQIDSTLRYVASLSKSDGSVAEDNYPVRRGTIMKLDDFSALLWVHGATTAINPRSKYFQGKRRIPAPLIIRRHAGNTDLEIIAQEILGLSKMNWNTLDLYTKFPATLQSSNEIARIGSLLQRFGAASYDYRLFI